MPADQTPQAKLSTHAVFPPKYFLENLAVRQDNSILVTAVNHKELWFVPPATGETPGKPVLLFTFPHRVTAVVEVEPEVFYLAVGDFYDAHEAFLYRLDLRRWHVGEAVQPERVFSFPDSVRGLNGACLIAPGILLIADSFAGLIWRVDLATAEGTPAARVWLKHESMGYFPGQLKPEQPGVNGVRFAERTHHLYYTATAKKLFMRVSVDPATHDAVGEPELVVAGRMGDDFCIDEDASVIYLTTHRQNTIDRVSMNPAENSGFTQSIAGDPFNEELIGPSSGAWSRVPGEYGRVAFFLSDGGTAHLPPDGIARPAKLLRVEIPEPPKRAESTGK